MPILTRDHLAARFRQNWMNKYPLDTCSNGGINLDDSLTSLNWLQNLNIMKITSPTPPPSPGPCNNYFNVDNNKNMKVNPNHVLNVSCAPPQCKIEPKFHLGDPAPPSSLNGDSIDYKTNPYVKPPYSYATLICMAMKETKKSKITLSAIYNWITDNFMYYRLADPSWQVGIWILIALNIQEARYHLNVYQLEVAFHKKKISFSDKTLFMVIKWFGICNSDEVLLEIYIKIHYYFRIPSAITCLWTSVSRKFHVVRMNREKEVSGESIQNTMTWLKMESSRRGETAGRHLVFLQQKRSNVRKRMTFPAAQKQERKKALFILETTRIRIIWKVILTGPPFWIKI